MFGGVVPQIGFAAGPADGKLFLVDSAIFEPVPTHINAFGTFLFHGTVDDTTSGQIISADWCWWLWMSHFQGGLTLFHKFLGIHEKHSYFSFHSGSHDTFNNFC